MRFGIILGLIPILWFASGQVQGADFNVSVLYTQTAYNNASPAVGTANLQYTLASNSITLTGYNTLISGATDASFGGADGILVNPINGNLLVGEGGTSEQAGVVFQITPTGAHASPYSVSPDSTPNPVSLPRVYFLAISPSNASKSGFPAGYLIGTEKDFGYGHISLMPISPNLANGIAYPVTGDDIYVTSVAFGADGTAYYGSGSENSNAGNFGTITFNGTQFTTHRLFGQPVGNDPRGGVIYTGTHGLIFDPLTNDIFTTGGNTVGQYDPIANVFHLLPIYGVASNFSFSGLFADGQGHLVVTACCGIAGDAYNGAGDIVVVDYSAAPGQTIDAASGVRYTHAFLVANVGATIIAPAFSLPPGKPVITIQPQNASALAGQTATFSITATGASSYQWQSKAPGASGFSSIPGATSSSYTTPPVTAANNNTQFACVVSNNQGSVTSAAATLTVLAGSTGYIIPPVGYGSLRNNYSGWVGMSVTVGSSPVTVTALGRMAAPQNSASHTLKIVDGSTGADIPGATAAVNMAGAVTGNFTYASLPAAVTLQAGGTYYFLAQEAAGGDLWYDWNTTAQTTTVANLAASIYGLPYTTVQASGGHLYGPVDFQYAV
ncbi:MAG: immunoglobulin domain-containing protein, partial [Acidobacteriia bacterium]|nr:immunoglobulin domain-containing protein [Terriglobia bacterium]